MKRVFISYSHKDEAHKEALNEQLSMLQRNKLIDAWHDRKIIPGQDWSKEISENLERSELILFLISPSFLASEYCFNVEMQRAIDMQSQGRAQIIAIIVRPCDWTTCELAKFQAVPKDAKPITTWGNQDEAWLDVINGIKKHLLEFKPTPVTIHNTETQNIKPTESILSWMEDTEVVLSHPKVGKIKLSDIYIPLDFEGEELNEAKEIEIIPSSVVTTTPKHYLIYGEEQHGKTSLLKYIYKELLKKKVAVIYLDAKTIYQSDISKSISKALKDQYIDLDLETFLALPNRAVLIDDIDRIGLNTKYRANFVSSINHSFVHSVVTCHSSFAYVSAEVSELNDYTDLAILGLGHIKRAELIEKWVSLGDEESIKEQDLYAQCDDLKAKLDTVIRKNIVPPKPIYLLMLLQMLEAYSQQNLELTSHGHCYQQLIYQALDHAGVPKDEVGKYLNVLTELAWEMHKSAGSVNQFELERFFQSYGEVYLPVDGAQIINKLKSNSILLEVDSRIKFKYPYLFYFFTAKKIAESFSTNQEVKDEVGKLTDNLHREDYANILVFVTHHTKEAWVFEEIQKTLGSLYSDEPLATLSKDQLAFMDKFIAQIPDLVMEQRVISEERVKQNKKLDELDRRPEDASTENMNILADINKAFKGMEISGQIIRNRHATLPRSALQNLANNGAFTGLRFLNYFIHMSESMELEVIRFIEQKLQEQPNLTNEKVEGYAKSVFLFLTYAVINGAIRKIASSIGSKEAGEIYAQIEKEDPSPAKILLIQAIDLHFKRDLDVESVTSTATKLKNNPLCIRILKEMIIQHTYMFPVEYKVKQQLASLLGIPVQKQRLMDRKKMVKA